MKYSKITISGKICTGKTTLFKNLQEKLGWPVFSTGQYFRDYAKKHDLSLEKAEEQDEKVTREVDTRVQDLLRKEGNLIADGWMTGIMANHYPGILKVLLVCRDSERIKRFCERENISETEAKKRLVARETNWFKKLEKIYQRNDFFDKKHYDVVIDTSKLTPEKILKEVLDSL